MEIKGKKTGDKKKTGGNSSIYRCSALLQRKELVEALPSSLHKTEFGGQRKLHTHLLHALVISYLPAHFSPLYLF
jgi:hypothetical protein